MSILRQLRKARKKTLSEVAKSVGINSANLSRIERGEHLPSRNTARELAQYYNYAVSAGELLDPPDHQVTRASEGTV